MDRDPFALRALDTLEHTAPLPGVLPTDGWAADRVPGDDAGRRRAVALLVARRLSPPALLFNDWDEV